MHHSTQTSHLFILLLTITTTAILHTPNTTFAAEDKIVLDSRVTPIPKLPHGPFVRLADGGILGVNEDSTIVTHDDGKTWKARPIFKSDEKFKIRPERAMLRTRAGTIVLIFANNAVLKYSWDKEKNSPLPDMHLPSYAIRSTDEGQTWTDLTLLDDGWCGCIQDIIQTDDGNIIVPGQEILFDQGRHATMPYVSTDEGRTWQRTRYLDIGGRGDHAGAIEGTLEQLRDGRVRMLLRSYHGFFYDSFSADSGFTWTDPKPSSIKTTGSPGKMKRLASGRLVLLHNAIPNPGFVRREQLSITFSDDDGQTWCPPQVIATNKGDRVCYSHLFEHTPGTLWITTMVSNLRVSLREVDFIKDWTKIVCFGDSTTAPRKGQAVYADLLQNGLSDQGLDLWVENSGVGSSTTDHARERFKRDVLDHRPRLVVIQFGINDSAIDVWKKPPASKPRVALSRYEENLNFFIDTLRKQDCEVILMTPNPLRWADRTRPLYGHSPYDPDDVDGFNLLLKDYAAAVRKIAAAKKVELIDVYALYESYDRQTGKSMNDLLRDGMHPNSTGHRRVADLLLEKIPRLRKNLPADK